MKKQIAIITALAAGISTASADELSVSTTFAWESSYIFRGAQFAEEYFAPAVDISYGGAYFGIWAALPVDAAFGNEVDYYAGYGFGAGEAVSLDVGFTYYTFPDIADDFFDNDTNTFEIYFGASFEVPMAPSVYVYYDFDLEALTFEGSVGHSVEISETTTFDVSGFLGYVDIDGGGDYTYYGASAGFGYAINDAVSASLYANWSGASEDMINAGTDDNELWFGFSVTAGM